MLLGKYSPSLLPNSVSGGWFNSSSLKLELGSSFIDFTDGYCPSVPITTNGSLGFVCLSTKGIKLSSPGTIASLIA